MKYETETTEREKMKWIVGSGTDKINQRRKEHEVCEGTIYGLLNGIGKTIIAKVYGPNFIEMRKKKHLITLVLRLAFDSSLDKGFNEKLGELIEMIHELRHPLVESKSNSPVIIIPSEDQSVIQNELSGNSG